MYAYCSRYNKTTKCVNCDCESDFDDNPICNTCGMEVLYSDIICIEDHYKKHYSSPFSTKRKEHNPYKHCENWLLQLQGKETVDISSENFNKIVELAKQWFNQNNVELSCSVIRNWLKRLSLTKYNTHITWLRKAIECACNIDGYSYELTSDEVIQILNYFSAVRKQFLNIKHDQTQRRNILYYPYILVKLLSHVIQDKNRLQMLLSNIHFQSSKTVTKNEYIWEQLKPF